MLSMWRGGRPQERTESHSLAIGYGTAWRLVKGSRHGIADGKRSGRAAAAGLVVGEARAPWSAYRTWACLKKRWMGET